jgi:hypothetical protein
MRCVHLLANCSADSVLILGEIVICLSGGNQTTIECPMAKCNCAHSVPFIGMRTTLTLCVYSRSCSS